MGWGGRCGVGGEVDVGWVGEGGLIILHSRDYTLLIGIHSIFQFTLLYLSLMTVMLLFLIGCT